MKFNPTSWWGGGGLKPKTNDDEKQKPKQKEKQNKTKCIWVKEGNRLPKMAKRKRD